MGQKQSAVEATFFCPTTNNSLADPLAPCTHCEALHDIIWQSVYICPNTGYRIDRDRAPSAARPDRECPSCFQSHQPATKRVYICPVTGATIPHPRDTGGKCEKCGRSHEDNSTPVGSREAVGSMGSLRSGRSGRS
ncbi:uncharacterized protein C8A04DRAFT_27669 [Dichotomopilus funicola]|uniref:Uncharacterized protein n=1 Tax=Dichotomopilus funicola TaxID=1934379 RepID=A0AAN6ZM86_9PEZI|nr:hypothetical protein C8A04DRAFT_27669 [Dichotomopilus funicola]